MNAQHCSYYVLYRKNKQASWSVVTHPFLVSVSTDLIIGQLVSSNWFKLILNEGDSLEFAIIKSQHTARERHITLLNQAELQRTNLMDLDFVVLYTSYSTEKIQLLREKLLSTLNKCHCTSSINDVVDLAHGVHMGLCFTIHKTVLENKYSNCKSKETNKLQNNIELCVTCPRFELNIND